MPQAVFQFPVGFLWGTVTSAHQVEGNNTNNTWSAWENEPEHIQNDGRSALACDWWGGRWKEDLDCAAKAGQNTHRFSIEWSRVQPEPDRWDEEALNFYREIARGMIERGITPMVTLHHFTDPLWLAEKRGWESEDAVRLFTNYCNKVVLALDEYVGLWCTINEPNTYTFGGFFQGSFPPGKQDLDAGYTVMANLIRGHAAAYHMIHQLQPEAQVGYTINYRSYRPAMNWSPLDKYVTRTRHTIYNDAFPRTIATGRLNFIYTKEKITEAVNTHDFIGLDYYTGDVMQFILRLGVYNRHYFPRDAELSDSGNIAHYPEGMYEALQWAKGFNRPIYITGNGLDNDDDHLRPRYILEHLHQAWRALDFNIPVKGYFHNTLIDCFEWEDGWTRCFGLWKLDPRTQERTPRPSAELYGEICKENGVSSDTVGKYAPQLMPKLFPG